MKKIRIGTYNIRNVTDHYIKRLPLLRKTFTEMNCDVIGLQEVSFIPRKNQLKDLNHQDLFYEFLAPSQLSIGEVNGIVDPEYNLDGNSVLISKNIFDQVKDNVEEKNLICNNKILHLSPIRTAQLVSFFINVNGDKLKVNFINTHLHHLQEDENIRVHMMKILLKWVDINTSEEDLTIIVGDFNALPESETYKFVLKSNYISLHRELHRNEPEITFHNSMDAPFKDDDPNGTFDYIL